MKKISTVLLLAILACPVFGQLTSWSFPRDIGLTGSDIVAFHDALYMVVFTTPRDGARLCKFDGVNFTLLPVPLPAPDYVVSYHSPLQVFQDNLYLLVTDWDDDATIPPTPLLYRFDGTNYTRIVLPFSQAPSTRTFSDMTVYRDELYIDVAEDEYHTVSGWVKYDGTNFSLINFPAGMTDNGKAGMTVYHDQLFCMMEATPGGAPVLTSYDGTSFHPYTIPNLMDTKMGVYDDKLILTQSAGGVNQLISFDGAVTASIPSPSGFVPIASGKEIYQSLLYLRMSSSGGGEKLMAYNGATLSPVASVPWPGAIEDFEVWRGQLYFVAGYLYAYQPLDLGTYYDFEHIDVNLFAHERGWCWNEVIINWTLPPICLMPPLCPDDIPLDVILYDKDKVIWESIEKKPFDRTIPVSDNPYTFSLASMKTGKPENILTVDPGLVGMGLATIKLSGAPYQNEMKVSLSVKKNEKVPVTLSFLNKKGAVVWEETLTAPVEKQLTVKPKEPGVKWLIAPAGGTLESAGITSTKYYPNPFDGKVTVELQTKGDKIPVQVTIDDPNGKRVTDVKLVAPVQQALELKDKKPGFYVLTFLAGTARRRVLIELK